MRSIRKIIIIALVILLPFTLISYSIESKGINESDRELLGTGKFDTLILPEDTLNFSVFAKMDDNGIPYFEEDGVRKYNPYALAFNISKYAPLDKGCSQLISKSKWINEFDINTIGLNQAAINNYNYLQDHLETKKYNLSGDINADLVYYGYDYTYNGRIATAPFSGSFAQVKWLQASLYLFCKAPSQETFDMVERAIAAYYVPIEDGGFTYTFSDGSVWFEEIPLDPPTHIFNAHILSLITLQQAINITGNTKHQGLVNKGKKALETRFYDYYDTGDFIRYDLNYKFYENMFRISPYFNEEYNQISSSNQIIISNIIPKREFGNYEQQNYLLNTSNNDEFIGASRLLSVWSDIITIDGQSGRAPTSKMFTPFNQNDVYDLDGISSFIIEFPSSGEGDAILEIEFFDNEAGYFTVDFRDSNAGNIYKFNEIQKVKTYGDKKWKTVEIKIPVKMLSGYIGPAYHARHIQLMKWYQETFDSNFFEKAIPKHVNKFLYSGDPPLMEKLNQIINILPNHATIISDNLDEEPYNAENLIDNNVNTNVGSANNLDYTFIEFKLDDVYLVRGINLINYLEGIGPNHIEIWSSDDSSENYHLNYEFKGNLVLRENAAFRFQVPFKADRLLIKFSDFVGQDRFIARELEIFADPEELYADKMLKEATGSGIEDRTVNYDRILSITKYLFDDTSVALMEFQY